VELVKIDVQDDESIQQAAEVVKRELKGEPLHLLINNSGILENDGAAYDSPIRQVFLKHFDVNTLGAVMTTHALLPLLRKAADHGGPAKVVNISSTLGSIELTGTFQTAFKNQAYGMSKAALNHYNRAFAHEEKRLISVVVCPGWVQTDMGGSGAQLSVDESVKELVKLIEGLRQEDSGKFLDRNGSIAF